MTFRHSKIFICLFCCFIISCKKNPTGYSGPSPYIWPVSTPQAQGMDPNKLSAAYQVAAGWDGLYSLLVVRNGFLVAENYYHNQTANEANNIQSVSKSMISAMVGIAFREGFIDSLDQKIVDFLPEYFPAGIDPRKKEITIRHLLTMTAGLYSVQPISDQWTSSSNWIQYALNLPLVANPGQQFDYNSALSHMLSAILTRSSGMSTFDLGKRFLFDPLGINCVNWYQDPQGYYTGGFSMYFFPRDLARFGELYLNNGLVNGTQVVPSPWVNESIQTHVPDVRADSSGYGYLWWTKKVQGHDTYYAEGYGGQFIYIISDLQLVVVTTADPSMPEAQSTALSITIRNFIPDYILSAINSIP